MKTIQVKVRPNANASALRQPGVGGVWHALVKSPPVDGKANRELVALVVRHFACHKSAASIRRGASGRLKQVRIED